MSITIIILLLVIACNILGIYSFCIKENNDMITYLIKIFLLPILISILLLILMIFCIYKKYYRFALINVFLLILCFIIMFIIPFNPNWVHNDYNNKLDNKDLFIRSTWVNIYNIDGKKIIKQIHTHPSNVINNLIFGKCIGDSCSMFSIMRWKLKIKFLMLSLKRYKKMNSKFFSKIYEIDEKNKTYITEYIPNSIDSISDLDFEKQLKELNTELIKNGYYITDSSNRDNWKVTYDGKIKMIDPEIITKSELEFVCLMTGQKPKIFKNCSNILLQFDQP